jgi:hypothetical protein
MGKEAEAESGRSIEGGQGISDNIDWDRLQ